MRKEKMVFGALMLMLFWAIPSIVTYAQDSATEGRDLYEEFCGACHGYDGESLLPGAPSFSKGERLEKSDTELLKSIMEGKGDIMPSWADMLSDEECESILEYIKSMVAKES